MQHSVLDEARCGLRLALFPHRSIDRLVVILMIEPSRRYDRFCHEVAVLLVALTLQVAIALSVNVPAVLRRNSGFEITATSASAKAKQKLRILNNVILKCGWNPSIKKLKPEVKPYGKNASALFRRTSVSKVLLIDCFVLCQINIQLPGEVLFQDLVIQIDSSLGNLLQHSRSTFRQRKKIKVDDHKKLEMSEMSCAISKIYLSINIRTKRGLTPTSKRPSIPTPPFSLTPLQRASPSRHLPERARQL